MNKQKRNQIERAVIHLREAMEIISDVKDDEQGSLDNMPENLQYSDRCQEMESAIDAMDDALDNVSDAVDSLEQI